MPDLKLEKARLDLEKLECALSGMRYQILERREDIFRIEEDIVIQTNAILEKTKEIKEFNNG